eukprot:RCo050694
MADQEAVKKTNQDACLHKMHCVTKGYWEDPFIAYFLKGDILDTPNSPLINRGYWARVAYIWTVIGSFLDQYRGQNPQVISIGAGWDMLFFRMRQKGIIEGGHGVKWVEVDFPDVNRKKKSVIASHSDLIRYISETPTDVSFSDTEVRSPSYSLLAADLRQPSSLLSQLLQQQQLPGSSSPSSAQGVGLRADCPTLLLSECVLVYMAPEHSDSLLRAFVGAFPKLTCVAYEAVKPNDPFGQMMVKNLAERGCALLSIHRYPTLEAQSRRYHELGFTHVVAWDMVTVYARLPKEERERVNRLELLDELEEWNMLLSHYCFVFASTISEHPFP